MKKLLLTGGTGFIGQQTIPFLQEEGYEIYAVTSKNLTKDNKDVQWLHGNLMDEEFVSSIFTKIHPTHLLHLAWITTPHVYWNSSENFNWVRASQYMFQCFIENGGERIVSTGSCAEYDWRYGYCSETLTPIRGLSAYANCKIALSILQKTMVENFAISAAWGRLFNIFGPNESSSRLIPYIIGTLNAGQVAELGKGENIRDFIFVKDAANALVCLLNCNVQEAVNIASGIPVSIRELSEQVADLLNRKDLLKFDVKQSSANEPDLLIADNNRLTNEVGYIPATPTAQALALTIDSWK